MTKTEIANIALAKFREGRITNIESNSDSVAVVMNDQYDHALELLLEEHRWNFASTRVTLTQLSDAPPFGWDHQYQLPADLIRLKDVNGEDVEASSKLFSLEGNALLTNDDTVTITYVAKITDVNLFSPSFVECLALKLASITCGRLTGDTELAIMLDRQYNQALSKSIHNDTKASGNREANLMQRMMGSSAILGGAYYPSTGRSSSSSSSSGSVAAHKHEVTDLLQTGATAGQALIWNDTTKQWEAGTAAGGSVSPLTTKGDIYGYDTDDARLGVGTDGQFLKADSTTATGLKWVTASGTGDLLSTNNLSDVASAATSRTNLGLGTAATSATGDFAAASHTHTASEVTDFDTEVSNNTDVAANTAKVTNVSTDLSYTAAPTNGTVTSSDGTNATVTLANVTNAGLLAPADFTKLGNQSGTNTGDEVLALTNQRGVAEIATTAEINSGASDEARMVTPYYFSLSQYALDITANNAKVTNATHTGDVTGDTALTIAAGAVDIAMMSATGTASPTTFLRGDNTWATVAGSGDVSKVGTPVNNQVGVWTGDGTIEGDTALTFDGSTFGVTGNISVTGTVDGVDVGDRDHDSVTLAGVPTYITKNASQQLTLHQVDLTADVSGDLPVADGGTGASDAATARTNLGVDAAGTDNSTATLGFACSDETTALTVGQKIAIDMPYGMIVERVYASVVTAGTTSAITVDVEDEGVSILNAALSITQGTNNAETSTFAAAATSYTLVKGDLLTIDIDSVDSGLTGAGLKVVLVGSLT